MAATSEKEHLTLVIGGHVNSGKSTTAGRLLSELGGLSERELEKYQLNAERKEFFTETKQYTLIGSPEHRDFIKNMVTGAGQADAALILVPADSFGDAIAKGNPKVGQKPGQTRQHLRLINLLGVKDLCIGVSKMDSAGAAYQQSRYDEVVYEMKIMLMEVRWKKEDVFNYIPMLPLSGRMGDNLLKKSDNMAWWKGQDIWYGEETIHVVTVYDVLDKLWRLPERPTSAPLRVSLSGVYKIKGVGDVLAGRVEQGAVKPGCGVAFVPTHSASNPCTGRVVSIEMDQRSVFIAKPGDTVGMKMKNLKKINMPRVGDVMVNKWDTLNGAKSFDAVVQVRDIPGAIKMGYSPIGHVRAGRAACRITEIKWKTDEDGRKVEFPKELCSYETALCTFKPQQPLVVEDESLLSRIAFMDGNNYVMVGKVISTKQHVSTVSRGARFPWASQAASDSEEEPATSSCCSLFRARRTTPKSVTTPASGKDDLSVIEI